MKAHSERVPDKNVRDFNGRPLFHWILGTLNSTSVVDEVVVDTDSPRIAEEAAKKFGATIIDRPEPLCGDEVSMNDIIRHDIEVVDADSYLQTHCTNPLLRSSTIDDAFEAFQDNNHDSLFSVTSHKTRLWTDGPEPLNHERDSLIPTQRLDPVYEENSNLYFFTHDSFLNRKNRIGDNPGIYEMNKEEAVDIDYPIDFRYAEFLHKDIYGNTPEMEAVVDR
ncbi:acylneuraminate cytidylyltransferase family protein [Halorubrum sp. SD626R]|nr:acylneuraminate cytidylyltransferase family protein [Halorubrum sp. SD626R]